MHDHTFSIGFAARDDVGLAVFNDYFVPFSANLTLIFELFLYKSTCLVNNFSNKHCTYMVRVSFVFKLSVNM